MHSSSFAQAAEFLSRYLGEMSCGLLFVGDYDAKSETSSHVIWSEFSPELTQLCAHFDEKRGCPLVQMAIKSELSFEGLGFYLAGFDDFFSMKYLKEMKKLGYHQIGVVPVRADDRFFVFFIGLDDIEFSEKVREHLCCTLAQFMASVSIRHLNSVADIDREAPPKNLTISKREKECLTWTAQGKTSYEISIILKLSEHTINNYISNACRRLDAANKSHAVAKAIMMGMIDTGEVN